MQIRKIAINDDLYWALEKLRVDRRKETIEDLLYELVGTRKTKQTGPIEPSMHLLGKGKSQVLAVINRMRDKGIEFNAATLEIAKELRITHGACRDSCTRRLGLDTAQFVEIVKDKIRCERLIAKLNE